MLLSPNSSNMPANKDSGMAEDVDEPPDERFLHGSSISVDDGLVYVKAPAMVNQKESLLTRALKTSPDLIPSDRCPSHDNTFHHSYPYHNVSGISTAELTSDGGMTSPSLSNTPSSPLQSQWTNKQAQPQPPMDGKANGADASESTVEANLGRKRCISFACGRKVEQPKQQQEAQQDKQPAAKGSNPEPTRPEPLRRKSALTFVCPARNPETKKERPQCGSPAPRSRPRGSPAPIARKPVADLDATPPVSIAKDQKACKISEERGVPTSGLGKFEDSEATRFHEFASSIEEDDEWVKKAVDYAGKITMSDCLKKENAIRKLGEEAEEEAMDEEDEEDDDVDDDEEMEDEDAADDDSTIHDFSDDGNESDNEAGFASDDSDASDNEFWAPSTTTAATTTPQGIDTKHLAIDRRNSVTSFESYNDERHRWIPVPSRKGEGPRRSKAQKINRDAPDLPDSTDFVCGTLDEDRPLEAAYKTCIEQRRMSKQVMIPQDIDPSFPTTDPEDNDDGDNDAEDMVLPTVNDEDPARGRSGEQTQNTSPRRSPKRMVSPPPRRQAHSPPKRLRSPPPPMKVKSPNGGGPPKVEAPAFSPHGLNINELVQRRPQIPRTKSLPRTPNPFFTSLEAVQWTGVSPLEESLETRDMHTRGPVDIVEGLEKKRQKRKEKFWRQHCRKAAREQMERRPAPGRGAERMKELGLEVAERCRAYGVGQDTQLVLSV